MTCILLAGAGSVGGRAARQLAETEGTERVLLADVDTARVEAVQTAVGDVVEPIGWSVDDPLPDGVDVLACALPPGPDRRAVERALEARVPSATSGDHHASLLALLDLDDAARERGVTVAVGCGLAPGLADVMARHAADALDTVVEVHVARFGVAGPACERSLHRARRGPAREWRDGAWREVARRARDELVWFPDPVGARECSSVELGLALLVRAFPDAARITYRAAEPPGRFAAGLERRRGGDPDWGATRVEVWGHRGQALETTVYGVIERTATATGTVLALVAAQLAGASTPRVTIDRPGVRGLAELVEPRRLLIELAARGVKIAAFEGTANADDTSRAS